LRWLYPESVNREKRIYKIITVKGWNIWKEADQNLTFMIVAPKYGSQWNLTSFEIE
jgi:hypothetical protein